MRIRTRRANGTTHVDLLLSHPMESGARQDKQGQKIPALYLTKVSMKHKGSIVAEVNLSPLISRNPVISLAMPGGESGEELVVTWEDSRQQTGERTAKIV